MTIIVRAEVGAPSRGRAEFLELAAALAAASSEEPGTLRYEWFGSSDPEVFVVIEEYADPDAAVAHNRHCAELLTAIGGVSHLMSVHLHGVLGPDLDAWVAERPFAHAHPPLLSS